jgi:hypothetical protein
VLVSEKVLGVLSNANLTRSWSESVGGGWSCQDSWQLVYFFLYMYSHIVYWHNVYSPFVYSYLVYTDTSATDISSTRTFGLNRQLVYTEILSTRHNKTYNLPVRKYSLVLNKAQRTNNNVKSWHAQFQKPISKHVILQSGNLLNMFKKTSWKTKIRSTTQWRTRLCRSTIKKEIYSASTENWTN